MIGGRGGFSLGQTVNLFLLHHILLQLFIHLVSCSCFLGCISSSVKTFLHHMLVKLFVLNAWHRLHMSHFGAGNNRLSNIQIHGGILRSIALFGH